MRTAPRKGTDDSRTPLLVAAVAAVGAAIALLAFPSPARAGAWTQSRGHTYARLAFGAISTRSRYDENGKRVGFQESGAAVRETEYRSREVRFYAEYGIRDRITGYGSIAYRRLAAEQATVLYETNGASDLYLGGRFRLNRGRHPLSVAGEVKAPTGYDTDVSPALGAGQIDMTVRGLAGTSWSRAYATADVGWTHRAGKFQNELLFSVELGGRVTERGTARAMLRGTRALGEPSEATPAPGRIFDPGLSSPRALTLDGAIGYAIVRNLDLEAGISHVLEGKNALAGTTVELALAWSGAVP